MRQGIKTLFNGILLFVIGAVLVPMAVIGPLVLDDSEEQQFVAPGRMEVMASEPGKYYLWNDYQTVYEGRVYNRSESLPDGIEIVVKNERGETLPFHSSTTISISKGSLSKNSIGYVEVAEPGTLSVNVSGGDRPRVFSFAKSEFLKVFGLIFGAVSLSILLGLTGMGITIWGIVKLAKNHSD